MSSLDEEPATPEHDRQWNRRKEKSQVPFFVALAALCLAIAYFLSHLS